MVLVVLVVVLDVFEIAGCVVDVVLAPVLFVSVHPISSRARSSAAEIVSTVALGSVGSMIPTRTPVSRSSFQWLACLPSPLFLPVDIANEADVSSKTAAAPGTRLRPNVVNSAGVEGSAPAMSANRSRSSGSSRTGRGDTVSITSTLELKPSTCPISCAATVSKSIVSAVTPSRLSKSKLKVELNVMVASDGPNVASRSAKPSAFRLALVADRVPSRVNPTRIDAVNCAAVGIAAMTGWSWWTATMASRTRV